MALFYNFMNSPKLPGMGGNDVVEVSAEVLERRVLLAAIKQELLTRIAEMWGNKEWEPILREDFKVRVRVNGSMVSTSKVITFGMVARYFETEVEEMLMRFDRRFQGRNLILEFWNYPYENGGRKMRGDVALKSVLPVPAATPKPKSQPRPAEVAERVELAEVSHAVREELQVQTDVALAVPEEVSTVAEILEPEQIVEETASSAASTTVVEETSQPLAEEVETEVITAVAPVVGEEAEEAPSDEAVAQIIKTVPPRPAMSPPGLDISAHGETVAGFLDKPINYDFREWKLYRTSPLPRKIRAAMLMNGIHTPRTLIEVLGTNCPSLGEWRTFIFRINSKMEKQSRLGDGSAAELLKWMRMKGLINTEFRAI